MMLPEAISLSEHDRQAVEALTEDFISNFGQELIIFKLFGSKARGEDTPDSDIDVLVVVKDDGWDFKHAMLTRGARLSLEYDVLFNLHIISKDRWDWMERVRYPLYRTITEDGVEIEFDSISGR